MIAVQREEKLESQGRVFISLSEAASVLARQSIFSAEQSVLTEVNNFS